MRSSLLFMGLLFLLLACGCSRDQVTAPSPPDGTAGQTALPGRTGETVTLEDLQAGFGTEKLAGPDVAITEFSAMPAAVYPGDVLTLQATVANLGSAAAQGPFDVWIGVLNTNFEFARVTIDRLLVQESRSGVMSYTVPLDQFAKAYPPGIYTLYCTHDFSDSNPTNNYKLADVELLPPVSPVGTIQVDVSPDGLGAGWILSNLDGYSIEGTDDMTLPDMPVGDYTITWQPVEGFQEPAPQQGVLLEGQTLVFSGFYEYILPPEALGMYFDQDATQSCTTASFLDHVTAYIIYRAPSLAEIRGFECGYDVTLPGAKGAAINTSITASYPVNVTDVGIDDTFNGIYNRIVGYAEPLFTTDNTIVATLDIFVLDSGEIDITMRAADPQSPPLDGLPKMVKPDFNLLSVRMPYAPGSPALIINGGDPCGVIPGK